MLLFCLGTDRKKWSSSLYIEETSLFPGSESLVKIPQFNGPKNLKNDELFLGISSLCWWVNEFASFSSVDT